VVEFQGFSQGLEFELSEGSFIDPLKKSL